MVQDVEIDNFSPWTPVCAYLVESQGIEVATLVCVGAIAETFDRNFIYAMRDKITPSVSDDEVEYLLSKDFPLFEHRYKEFYGIVDKELRIHLMWEVGIDQIAVPKVIHDYAEKMKQEEMLITGRDYSIVKANCIDLIRKCDDTISDALKMEF